ncbi:DUF1376 domain-containing protein [Bartonella sp. CB74]|uniref:DUF1376 domain-containing protein n=1 Tax=Bartonella sp. CB74 TaxID=3113620 RepID=UPI002F96315B
MANKLPWVRNFYQEWIMDFAGTDAVEKAAYSTLTALMYRACEPIYDDTSVLARAVGCSVQAFKKSLEKLIRKKLILQLENGNLWSAQVEEELKNCNDNFNKLSEKAIKAANTRRNNKHKDNSSGDHDDVMMTSSRQHINNNIYNKKTNTIVLAKKEIDFEDSETVLPLHEPNSSDELKTLPVQNEDASNCSKITDAVKSFPTHEQENIPKKVKRSRADQGCRLPDDFEPDYDCAIQGGLPPERVNLEIAKFRDYWNAKAGKDATKHDWPATWRNWVRRTVENLAKGNNYGKETSYQTGQQRGWGHRVAEHIRNIKHSDSAYKFLFEDDARPTIPLASGTKAIDCRSGASHCLG